MRLVMIGPFPPPIHGMSLANEMLHKGLIKNHVVYRIDTKSGLILEDTPKQGKFNLKKIFYAIWPEGSRKLTGNSIDFQHSPYSFRNRA